MAVRQAEIVAVQHTLTSRVSEGWWLEVVWSFRNYASRPLYVLSQGPRSISVGQTLIVNHTAADHPAVDPNADPDMEFVTMEAHDSLDLSRTYPLPPVDTPFRVVGRFAASFDPPDPAWSPGHVWGAVARWQEIQESSPFDVETASP